MKKALLTERLALPGVTVEAWHFLEGDLILTVMLESESAICPRCGRKSDRLHQNHRLLVRDLPMYKHAVWLKINRRQFKCPICRAPFSERLDFVGARKRYTHRYARAIVTQALYGDLQQVAHNNQLTYSEVESAITHLTSDQFPLELQGLKHLGCYSLHLFKNSDNPLVVLINLDSKEILRLVKGLERVKPVLQQWSPELRIEIKQVFLDFVVNKANQNLADLFPQAYFKIMPPLPWRQILAQGCCKATYNPCSFPTGRYAKG